MIPPRTLRRKLQKKLKHKWRRKCPRCTDLIVGGLEEGDTKVGEAAWRLFYDCPRCKVRWELFWAGGGKADTYPIAATTP